MAKKNAPAKEAKKEVKKAKGTEVSAEEKAAKRKARMEKLKNRPEGQRPNSRQVDIIETENGKVMTFGYPIRKTGTLVTTVAMDKDGNIISVSTVFVPNTKVKVKKGHGNIIPGLAGKGKGKDADEDEDEDGEGSDDSETELED